MHPETAASFGLSGEPVVIVLSGHTLTVKIIVDETIPAGVALAPRSVGLTVSQPVALALQKVEAK
jgi:anaerobic selenocysteine-containing dehydrogenase